MSLSPFWPYTTLRHSISVRYRIGMAVAAFMTSIIATQQQITVLTFTSAPSLLNIYKSVPKSK